MTTGTVTGALVNPDGTPQAGTLLRFYLLPSTTTPFNAAGANVVAVAEAVTASDGTWSQALENTHTMNPPDQMAYAVSAFPAKPKQANPQPIQYFTVPGTGTYPLSSVLTSVPAGFVFPSGISNISAGSGIAVTVAGGVATVGLNLSSPLPTLPATLLVGSSVSQYGAQLAARKAGASVEFGHTNTAGFGSTLGAESGTGAPFLAFNAGPGTTANTYKTLGNTGRVIKSGLDGTLTVSRVTGTNADNQALTTDFTLSATGAAIFAQTVTGPLLDLGGGRTSMKAYGFLAGSGNATANGVLFDALLLEIYNGTKPSLIDADVGSDVYIAGRHVFPNTTGASFIGSIGSAVPFQPLYQIVGRRNTSGQNVGRLVFTYVSPNATSTAGTLSAASGSATLTITGTKPPQGTVDLGFPVRISDGTREEAVQVTAINVSAGVINSVTVTLSLSGYSTGAGAATLSWPIRNDAKLVSLGLGDLVLSDVTIMSSVANDTTPFLLCTNSRPHATRCQFLGSNGADVFPSSFQTGRWPTQDALIFGGTGQGGAIDGSLSGAFAGYVGHVRDSLFFGVRAGVVFQTFTTTIPVENNYFVSTCGSPYTLGGAIESYSSSTTGNNSIRIASNQLEITNYQNAIWLGIGSEGFTISSNQLPDAYGSTNLASSYTAGASTISLVGYLPERELAPYLYSLEYGLNLGPSVEYVRFTGAPTPAQTTTLSGAVTAGATSIVVASATGIATNGVVLLDHGTWGLQEALPVASVSGTTVTFVAGYRTAFAHGNGAAVWVGPFLHTLETPAVTNHPSGTRVSPSVAGVRAEASTFGNVAFAGNVSTQKFYRDLNTTPQSISLYPTAGGQSVLGVNVLFPGFLSATGTVSLPGTGTVLLNSTAAGVPTRLRYGFNASGWGGYLFQATGASWLQGLSSGGYYDGATPSWTNTNVSGNPGATALVFRHDAQILLQTTPNSSTTAPITRLQLGSGQGTPALTTGSIFQLATQTFTDTATAASGTAPAWVGSLFAIPTLAATNASVTTTLGYNVYIAGAPVGGTNQSIPTRAALGLNTGATGAFGIILDSPTGQLSDLVSIRVNGTAKFRLLGTGQALLGGGLNRGMVASAKTGNYTAVVGQDDVITADATAGAITITLPSAATALLGAQFTVVKVDSSANVVNVGTTSSQTINGAAAPYTGLSAQWNKATFISNASNWIIIG